MECKNEKRKKTKEFWLKITPEYAIEYLKVSEKNKNWNLMNLFEFIIEDLDVRFIDFYIKKAEIGAQIISVNSPIPGTIKLA